MAIPASVTALRASGKTLRREVQAQGATEQADLIVGGCQGRCDFGPNLIVHPGATKYSEVKAPRCRPKSCASICCKVARSKSCVSRVGSTSWTQPEQPSARTTGPASEPGPRRAHRTPAVVCPVIDPDERNRSQECRLAPCAGPHIVAFATANRRTRTEIEDSLKLVAKSSNCLLQLSSATVRLSLQHNNNER